MQRLSADEIASMLLARLVREVENFAASRRLIDDDAKAEEVWRRFVKYLKDCKPSTLLQRMSVVLSNVDYFEELSARLVAGATSGEEAVALTQVDLTNLRKLVEIQLFVLKDQLERGFSSATKEA